MNHFKTILLCFIALILMQCKSTNINNKYATIDLLKGELLSNFNEFEGWKMIETVETVPNKTEFKITSGAKENNSILSNGTVKTKQPYLITKRAFKDVKIDLEFMIPKRSNSGIYVMECYEIQILDSYGRKEPKFSDLGGIYQSWDPEKKERRLRGTGGIAPMVNAAKVPGEWQTLSIVFRAPRFNSKGIKVENARFISVKVNDILVQDNVEVTRPTRQPGDRSKQEVPFGPIAIQGDHGPIAFKSFKVTLLKKDPLLDIE